MEKGRNGELEREQGVEKGRNRERARVEKGRKGEIESKGWRKGEKES